MSVDDQVPEVVEGRSRCLVMGVVNRTPDSFYDGGRMQLDDAVAHALRLADEGADILDIGAIKAGPGDDVEEGEEQARLLPLVEEVARRTDVPLSVETARPAVAAAAIAAGATVVNDVSGLAEDALAWVCARSGIKLVLMHNGGQLRGRPRHPRYRDVVLEVARTWDELAERALQQGMEEHQLIFDVGLDFGKTTSHSLEIMRRLPELVARRRPVLVAASHKDVVGETLALPVDDRLEGSLALAALAVAGGAAIVRVHDVLATVRVVAMVEAVLGKSPPKAPVRGLWD